MTFTFSYGYIYFCIFVDWSEGIPLNTDKWLSKYVVTRDALLSGCQQLQIVRWYRCIALQWQCTIAYMGWRTYVNFNIVFSKGTNVPWPCVSSVPCRMLIYQTIAAYQLGKCNYRWYPVHYTPCTQSRSHACTVSCVLWWLQTSCLIYVRIYVTFDLTRFVANC